MELKLWSPFFDLDKEWRFDFPRFGRELAGFDFWPKVDLIKKEDEMLVTAELPGLDPKDIEVSIEGDILTIKGEKLEEKEVTEESRYVHERSYGKFQRRIPLPEGTSADKMTASYDKGVLTLKLPKAAEVKPASKSIPIA
jgi:HSP20 family protein